MKISLLVFWSILQTFLLMCLGSAMLKIRLIRQEELPRLTKLGIDVFTPFLTFSLITKGFDPYAQGRAACIMPFIGFGVMALGFAFGALCKSALFHRTEARSRSMHHLCAINNYFFLPLIIIQNIWGENSEQAALLAIMNVGSTIGFWPLGIISMAGSQTFGNVARSLFSTNILAIVLGLGFSLLNIQVPLVIANTSQMLANMAIPFTMLLTGASLTLNVRGLFSDWKDCVLVNALRLVVIPALTILLLKVLPIGKVAYETSVVYALMPSAVISILIARQHGGSEEFAGQTIAVSTLLSLLSVPIWMHFLIH